MPPHKGKRYEEAQAAEAQARAIQRSLKHMRTRKDIPGGLFVAVGTSVSEGRDSGGGEGEEMGAGSGAPERRVFEGGMFDGIAAGGTQKAGQNSLQSRLLGEKNSLPWGRWMRILARESNGKGAWMHTICKIRIMRNHMSRLMELSPVLQTTCLPLHGACRSLQEQ